MKKLIFLFSFALAAANVNLAQQNFSLRKASKLFDVRIRITGCDFTDAAYKTCEGRASVFLSKKKSARTFQTIEMPKMFLELSDDNTPTANLIELYGENNSGVVFQDFNFDGAADLALRSGNDGAYGGPSYDVLLFSEASNKFIKNIRLTKLASENLGLFTVDARRKTIETLNKSGCCYHETTRYRIVNNRPQKIYFFSEQVMTDGKRVELTTRRLVRGKWKQRVRYVKTGTYYGK